MKEEALAAIKRGGSTVTAIEYETKWSVYDYLIASSRTITVHLRQLPDNYQTTHGQLPGIPGMQPDNNRTITVHLGQLPDMQPDNIRTFQTITVHLGQQPDMQPDIPDNLPDNDVLEAMAFVAKMKESADRIGAGFVGGFTAADGTKFVMTNMNEDDINS